MQKQSSGRPINKIQNDIFGAMLVVSIFTTLLIAVISIMVNLNFERESLDSNLRNIAFTITKSELVRDEMKNNKLTEDGSLMYLDSIKSAISNVDVISVVSNKGERLYHTKRELIGTTYDGTIPNFASNGYIYITNDIGPSGPQRRVYAAIFDSKGQYEGFVLVVILSRNINRIIMNTVIIHLFVLIVVILIAVIVSDRISKKIRNKLWGYEPDAFSAMYSVRENILKSFEEGVIAIDYNEKILFMNNAAMNICQVSEDYSFNIKDYPMLSIKAVRTVLKTREKVAGIQTKIDGVVDAIVDYYPVIEKGTIIGAICLLKDRTEYTKVAEDLSGVKFLVESMRANNHDFTNKLHVILGLIQMGANKEAVKYISNITSIQQEIISNIMRNIEEASVAALLIGKYSQAAELNIDFSLESGSSYKKNDVTIGSGDLVTVIGNLVENAMDEINESNPDIRELSVGIFSRPGALLIRVNDSGRGIKDDIREKILENGVTSKGENHGTGLFIVKQIVNRYNGTIEFETETGVGTVFTVTIVSEEGGTNNV